MYGAGNDEGKVKSPSFMNDEKTPRNFSNAMKTRKTKLLKKKRKLSCSEGKEHDANEKTAKYDDVL